MGRVECVHRVVEVVIHFLHFRSETRRSRRAFFLLLLPVHLHQPLEPFTTLSRLPATLPGAVRSSRPAISFVFFLPTTLSLLLLTRTMASRPSASALELSVTLSAGPLLPLLPPKPITRSLPPLAPSPPSSIPGWKRDTFILPAAFPRTYKNTTKPPGTPKTTLPKKDDGRIDAKRAFEELVNGQVEGFREEISLEDKQELQRQEQLSVVVARYRPQRAVKLAQGEKGLTLVFSHANGFYKGASPSSAFKRRILTIFERAEVWEPTLSSLLSTLDANVRALPVQEVWALDCINQGDSAILNDEVLGDVCAFSSLPFPAFCPSADLYDPTVNWGDHGRDVLNFIISYMDSPTLASLPPNPASPVVLAPAPDVPPTLFSLDASTPAPGSTTPTSRTYRDRLIVAIGHSLGGGATAYAATALPSLFSSLIFVDPVLPTPSIDTRSMEVLSTGAIVRKEKWGSRKEALEGFEKKPFFGAWDRKVLEGYVEHGLKAVDGGVALKTTARNEAVRSFLFRSLPVSLPVRSTPCTGAHILYLLS